MRTSLRNEGGLRTRGIIKANLPGKPLVSIITVTFNRVYCLEKAMLSVFSQNYQNIEYILIDGASNDGSLELIKSYDNKIDYWFSEPDKGMYYALNKGIQFSNGALIGICHSDDIFYSNEVIDNLIATHKSKDADLYHGDMISISKNGISNRRLVSNADKITETHNSIIHTATFVKKEIFNSIGLYNTNYHSAADYELMLRIKLGHYKFCHLDIIVCAMNTDGKDRVSNNCYSHIEAYQFHRDLKTGNHFQYLISYFKCISIRFLKSILHKISIYNK